MSKYGGIPVDTGSKYGGVPVEGDSFFDNAVDVAGEFAAGANRVVSGTLDLPIDAVNAGLRLGDVDYQLPTFTGANAKLGGQGGFMEPGIARDIVSAAGTTLPAAASLTQVPRNLATKGGAAAEWLGFGSAKAPEAVVRAGAQLDPSRVPTPTPNAPAAISDPVARDLALKRRSGDVVAAGHKLNEVGEVVADKTQQRAISGGIPERIVAQFHAGSPADKKRLGLVLDEVEKGLKNKTYGDFNPPRMVMGDGLADRFNTIQQANKSAGKAVGEASEALRNQPVDLNALYEGPVSSFVKNLEDMDVVIGPNNVPDFSQSVFKKSPAAQKAMRDTIEAIRDIKNPNSAYEIHKAKQVIDDMAEEYGKSGSGLSGKADRTIKNLRHDFNTFLRERYPDYANANDSFSETREILDETQRLIGRKNTATPGNLGMAARKALSNYSSREQMQALLDNMDDMSRKYGGDYGDDLRMQNSAVQSIEEMFPSTRAPAGFAGQTERGVKAGVDALAGRKGVTEMAIDAAKEYFSNGEVAEGMKKIGELRALLKD